MGLLVYKFYDYEYTADREQFRNICKLLRDFFKEKEALCVFIGNYNVFDRELDAILIKTNSIIAVEFKNYRGDIFAINKDYRKSSGIIKDRDRKSVYQQVRLNRAALKHDLKEWKIVPAKFVKDVAALVVLHKSIKLDNKLSGGTQRWLHICNETTFLEKVEDITSANISFTNEDLFKILKRLNLTDEYLVKEYSDMNILIKNRDTLLAEKVECNANYSHSIKKNVDATNEVVTQNALPFNIRCVKYTEEVDIDCLYKFVLKIIETLFPDKKYPLFIYRLSDLPPQMLECRKLFSQKYVVAIEVDDPQSASQKISQFIKKNVWQKENLICWEEGLALNDHSAYQDVNSCNRLNDINSNGKIHFVFPVWLDDFIYNDLEAIYKPDFIKFEYNLNLNKKDLRTYLGTYFPRSFVETYSLFEDLFSNTNILQLWKVKDSISIMDFGCGTGGEIFGLLYFIDKEIPNIKKVTLLAIDGNNDALRIFERILDLFSTKTRLCINYRIGPVNIESESDFEMVTSIVTINYEIILSSKAINEFVTKQRISKNAYFYFAEKLSKKLSNDGIMLFVDVTVKNEVIEEYLPIYMSKGINTFIRKSKDHFATILPFSCAHYEKHCKNGCFYNKVYYISHSHKRNDISKITYRFIGHSSFCNELVYTTKITQ